MLVKGVGYLAGKKKDFTGGMSPKNRLRTTRPRDQSAVEVNDGRRRVTPQGCGGGVLSSHFLKLLTRCASLGCQYRWRADCATVPLDECFDPGGAVLRRTSHVVWDSRSPNRFWSRHPSDKTKKRDLSVTLTHARAHTTPLLCAVCHV